MPVTAFEIRSREPFDGGRAFGNVGAYERVEGVLHYAVDPANESNLGIVDLAHAARDEQGRVRFQGDVTLLRPVDPAQSNGRLLCDVVNRGGRRFMRYNLATADALHPEVIPAGDGYLMERGWTVAAIGWQWDVLPANGRLALDAPSALDAAGRPIQGSIIVSHQPSTLVPHFMLSDRGHAPYTVADPQQADAQLIVRDFPNGTRQEIPREQWRFGRVEGGVVVPDNAHVALDGGFEPGRYYEAVYRTDICPVVGAGLLAFRDAASFFRYSTADDNPVRGIISNAFALGVSQSGRFLREFLFVGANLDEEARTVFDGIHLHIAGGRRGEFNHRYAQPSVIEPYSFGHLPPYAYDDTVDPRDQTVIPGLLTRLRARGGVPKMLATNSATEYWRGDASALHVDPDGARDLADPAEARTYLLASMQHGSGTLPLRYGLPGEPPTTINPLNICDYGPLFRAVIANLEAWVCDGVEPPASALPRLADRTALTRNRTVYDFTASTSIDTVAPKRMWSLPRLDFGPESAAGIGTYPAFVGLMGEFPTLVSAVDVDGNERAGIRLPDVAVPLATHTGWNPRHLDTGGLGETAGLSGSTIPFAVTAADRERTGDPRLSIEERYRDRDDYLAQVRAAAEALAADRYLLAQDIDVAVANAGARWDALVPAVVA
ncbi:MAG: hypothetical protein DWI59_04370 [Chloroflexi bacterium]|nr:MAG: hypothetical protein DWI59_04370 [Chloroflexota bacterium]